MEPDGAQASISLEKTSDASPASPASNGNIPLPFYCPISRQYMRDPVVLSDGHSYERHHIEQWLQENETSPVTGAKLDPVDRMFPNHALRKTVEDYLQVFCEQASVPLDAKTKDGDCDDGTPSSSVASPVGEVAHTAEISEVLSNIDEWQIDTLTLSELTGKRPLSVLALRLFGHRGLLERFSLDRGTLAFFLSEIERGYDDGHAIPYHNRAHAASVLHMMHMILAHGGVEDAIAPAFRAESACGEAYDGQLEYMSCIVAAALHDYQHLGLSNDFLVKSHHERALRYNDQHVNENHHAAAALAVLHRPECNFLKHLPANDYRRLRGLVVELVLATDMAENNAILTRFKQETVDCTSPFVPTSGKSAVLLLQVAIKCADIGHLALRWELHGRWVKRLEAEFFAQGDREKALGMSPVSFLMDRDKPGVSKSQVGFLDFVALPLFRALTAAAPLTGPMLGVLEDNTKRWREVEAARKAGDDGEDGAA